MDGVCLEVASPRGVASDGAGTRLSTVSMLGVSGAAADVYAAGLVLYQCLAGRLPWPAGSVTEMLYAHSYLPPHPLPLLGLPPAIEEICMQCLSREHVHFGCCRVVRVAERTATKQLSAGLAEIYLDKNRGQ
jgi:serine/threonine-protein kinase